MESEGNADEGEGEREHTAGVPDGCGCAEIWEHLTEQRAAED